MSVKQLEHALAARVVVEQAIGVLTERQHSSPRQAFERLRKVARSRGPQGARPVPRDRHVRDRPGRAAAARAGRTPLSLRPRSPEALAEDLVALLVAAGRPAVRVLLDGVGLARAVRRAACPGCARPRRPPLQVHAEDFLRPAGERFEFGREDEESFRTTWLDAAALDREVLSREGGYLPALWDAAADRSARRRVRAGAARGGAARRRRAAARARAAGGADGARRAVAGRAARRGVPAWQLPAFARYDREVRPARSATSWCGRRTRCGRLSCPCRLDLAEGRLEERPERVGEHADDRQPEQDPAVRLRRRRPAARRPGPLACFGSNCTAALTRKAPTRPNVTPRPT
jgi:hypothetical protein